MNKITKLLIWSVLLTFLGCEKEKTIKFHLNTFDTDKYYQEEIIPDEYQQIYGQWELYEMFGGIGGVSYEPDYDYLEIKSMGIYGLVRNDSLFEYGKIELDTFNTGATDYLQVKLVTDYNKNQNPRHYPLEYIELKGPDLLNMLTVNPDGYNYYYKRVQ